MNITSSDLEGKMQTLCIWCNGEERLRQYSLTVYHDMLLRVGGVELQVTVKEETASPESYSKDEESNSHWLQSQGNILILHTCRHGGLIVLITIVTEGLALTHGFISNTENLRR